MASAMKPIVLYWHYRGPKTWKVLVILEELGFPYKTSWVELEDLKKEPFVRVNPYGLNPVIEDPNTGITLWESAGIISYLIDTYDKEGKLTYTSTPKKYFLEQWSYFQESRQGPYFGQCAWFALYHPEKLESAQTRYANEVKRIAGELNLVLQGQDWLVGNKCTYADLAFVIWNTQLDFIMEGHGWNIADYPNFKRWQEAMLARDSLKKVISFLINKDFESAGRA